MDEPLAFFQRPAITERNFRRAKGIALRLAALLPRLPSIDEGGTVKVTIEMPVDVYREYLTDAIEMAHLLTAGEPILQRGHQEQEDGRAGAGTQDSDQRPQPGDQAADPRHH